MYDIIAFWRHKNYTQLVSNYIRNYQINQINSLSPNRSQVTLSLQKHFFYCRYKRLLIHIIVQFYGISLALLKFMRRIFITRKKERKDIPFNRDCCFERKSKRLYSSGLDICTHTQTKRFVLIEIFEPSETIAHTYIFAICIFYYGVTFMSL